MISIQKYTIAVLFIITTLLIGCTEDMSIKLDGSSRRLVVDGNITDQLGRNFVKLTLSGNYFDNEPMPVVSDAIVSLNDGFDLILLVETNPGSGVYLPPSNFRGIARRNYTLSISNVDVDNDGINESYSASSYLNKSVGIESVGIGYQKNWSLWKVLLYAKEPGSVENYYMFKVYKNDSLVTDQYSKYSTADDKFFNGNQIGGVWVYALDATKVEEDLKIGDIVKLEMCSIEKSFFRYLQAVATETQPKTPLFSGPSANVPGNISNGAYGFFAAYSASVNSATVNKSKAEY